MRTIKRRYTGNLVAFGKRYNPFNAAQWSRNVAQIIARLKRLHNGILPARTGQCVVLNGKVLADLPLPIAGLMSTSPAADVAARIEALKTAARQTGSTLSDPFATLSFLALPVIPALKLTDRGLFAL